MGSETQCKLEYSHLKFKVIKKTQKPKNVIYSDMGPVLSFLI